ncbi:MAG: hypothetical protein H6657_07605 [Ardenticatenaceae bacterium]|nr:hypothetical protein [Ardenticatenaceae bacterium]
MANNSFEPVRSLNGAFSAHGSAAGIAYSQSYSVVKFLLETYGQKQMQSLILTLAQGIGYDEALEAVYGFNVDGRSKRGGKVWACPARDSAHANGRFRPIHPHDRTVWCARICTD